MFDKIVYISDRSANIRLKDSENLAINLMNLHLVFEDKDKKVLGEVDDLDKDIVSARFLGEIVNGKLIGGTIRKPSLDATIRVIDKSEIPMIVGEDKDGYIRFGVSPFYNDFPVFLDVNNFFSNHFAIFGNSGSGKSCGVSRLFQNMFHDKRLFPYKSNIVLFDSSGEYYNAFCNLNTIDPNYHYRFFSTNEVDGKGEKLRIPIWLLNATDLALLLQATSHSQLPIIERMLKLALIFSQKEVDADKFKNHLIAKAIMTILYTNETAPNKRNEIFSILASCSTPQFNLEAPVKGIGYTRKFRECFLIDSHGQFSESVLLTEYVSSFIKDEFDDYEPKGGVFYDLTTLEKALNFTLISEGWLRNENTYGDAVTIKVRLHSLIVGDNAKYFDVKEYVSLDAYLSSLLINNGRKYQMVNINFDDVDDDFAKVITKIYSRLMFEFAKNLKDRASMPFHIVVEEAHRYIQNDTDRFLIGYNIFERIAKEGRKYGVILGLISQRPVELSDTVISQCSNFLIFKMNHPTDVDYIRKMVPNISDEIIEKQKTLQPGTCLGFGMGFKIPLICRLEMPDPAPWSGNCNVVSIWKGEASSNVSTTIVETPTVSENIVPTFEPSQLVSNDVAPSQALVDIVDEDKSVPNVSGNISNLVDGIDNNITTSLPEIGNANSLVDISDSSSSTDNTGVAIPDITPSDNVVSSDVGGLSNLSMLDEGEDDDYDDEDDNDDYQDSSIVGVSQSIPTDLKLEDDNKADVKFDNGDIPKPLVDIIGDGGNDSDNNNIAMPTLTPLSDDSDNKTTSLPTTDTGIPLVALSDE
ncbi:MAG: DUF87 domain-containing protein [Firmicutes bacterium]|nr:DUF87 domain-containing protein [Bacillota bacterium]